jgi:hypothetical protein
MFVVVVLFIIVQIIILIKGVETVPFFIFNLYSGKITPADTTRMVTYYLNGKKFNTEHLINREKETLLGSYDYYLKLRSGDFLATDTNTINKRFKGKIPDQLYHIIYKRLTNARVNDSIYLYWWRNYFSQVTDQHIDSITIITSSIYWKPDYYPANDTLSIQKYVFAKRD